MKISQELSLRVWIADHTNPRGFHLGRSSSALPFGRQNSHELMHISSLTVFLFYHLSWFHQLRLLSLFHSTGAFWVCWCYFFTCTVLMLARPAFCWSSHFSHSQTFVWLTLLFSCGSCIFSFYSHMWWPTIPAHLGLAQFWYGKPYITRKSPFHE